MSNVTRQHLTGSWVYLHKRTARSSLNMRVAQRVSSKKGSTSYPVQATKPLSSIVSRSRLMWAFLILLLPSNVVYFSSNCIKWLQRGKKYADSYRLTMFAWGTFSHAMRKCSYSKSWERNQLELRMMRQSTVISLFGTWKLWNWSW